MADHRDAERRGRLCGSASPTAEMLVSVIIPARNEEALIRGAMDSALAQSYPLDRIECVVVDNASEDNTSAIARHFGATTPMQMTVVIEPTIGRGAAKNRGARTAQGDILLFLDGDSRMAPGLLSDVVAAVKEGSPAGSIRIVADSNDWLERSFFKLLEFGKVLFGIRAQMMYCRRDLFHALEGFKPELHIAEDLEFLQRAERYLRAGRGGTVCHVRRSCIATSPRRLRSLPFRLGVLAVFARWSLAHAGIGRRRPY